MPFLQVSGVDQTFCWGVHLKIIHNYLYSMLGDFSIVEREENSRALKSKGFQYITSINVETNNFHVIQMQRKSPGTASCASAQLCGT